MDRTWDATGLDTLHAAAVAIVLMPELMMIRNAELIAASPLRDGEKKFILLTVIPLFCQVQNSW